LVDLTLDGNLIFNKKGYIEFCLKSCPRLQQLDMRKITPEMRNQSGISQLTGNDDLGKDEGPRQQTDSTQAATSDYMDRIQGVSTGGSSHPQPTAGAGGMTNPVLGQFMNNQNNSQQNNQNNAAGAIGVGANQNQSAAAGQPAHGAANNNQNQQ